MLIPRKAMKISILEILKKLHNFDLLFALDIREERDINLDIFKCIF